MEDRLENERQAKASGSGKRRIKNITMAVETHQFDPDRDSILPKTGWEERMAEVRSRSQWAGRGDKAGTDNSQRDFVQVGGQYEDLQTDPDSGSAGQGSTMNPRVRRVKPETASQLSREFEEEDQKSKKDSNKKKKNTGLVPKIVAVVLVLVIIVGSIFLMRNYGAGSRSSRKGIALYENGEYAEAQAMFEKALSYDSGNSEYLVNLGMTQIARKDYEGALASFDSAVQNTHRESVLQMAKRGAGIVYLYEGYYTKAVELFNEALGYAGGSYTDNEIDILYYLAEAQDRTGDCVGAVLSYSEIIRQQADANAYMLRGLAYQRVGDNTKAEDDLDMAIEMSKKNYKTYLALYEVLMAQEKNDEAIKTLREALELGGKNGEDYSNRGIVYMYLEDYASAAEAFNVALEKGYVGAYMGLAESLMRQEDYAGAIVQYENFIAQGEASATAYNQYGLCLMKEQRYTDAAAAFAAGLALNDRLVDQELMFNEAVAYEYLSDWATAYEKMKAFTEKYPDDAQGQHELVFLESRQ